VELSTDLLAVVSSVEPQAGQTRGLSAAWVGRGELDMASGQPDVLGARALGPLPLLERQCLSFAQVVETAHYVYVD